MKQILHILRKDLRHHWPEALSYAIVCAAWAWQLRHPASFEWMRQRQLLPILFFGLWVFTTIRVVHGESLVGDRQFWMTRPYRWGQLLAAKALVLVLILNLPLAIAQIALLHQAGLSFHASNLAAMLFQYAYLDLLCIFPTAVLASISESLVQWVLTVAGLIVYGLVVTWLPWSRLPATFSGEEDTVSIIGAILLSGTFLFILVWQYARRRVWWGRAGLALAAVLVPLVILLAHVPVIRSISYPVAKGPIPLQFLGAGADGQRSIQRSDFGYGTTGIRIPVSAVASSKDVAVQEEGLRFILLGDNGFHWESDWENRSFQRDADGETRSFTLTVPTSVADQLLPRHARVSAELLYHTYRLGKAVRVDTSQDTFDLPGVGQCTWKETVFDQEAGRWQYKTRRRTHLTCLAAYKQPVQMWIGIESGSNTCPAGTEEETLPSGHWASVIHYGTAMPADLNPDPVQRIELGFSGCEPEMPISMKGKPYVAMNLCRGTPLFLRLGHDEGRARSIVNLGQLQRVVVTPPKEDSE